MVLNISAEVDHIRVHVSGLHVTHVGLNINGSRDLPLNVS